MKEPNKKEKSKRMIAFKFRATPEEAAYINERYKLSGFTNKGAFFRRLILKGTIVRMDLDDIRAFSTAMSRYSNNVNQIINHLKQVEGSDEQELLKMQERQAEIDAGTKEILMCLGRLQEWLLQDYY